MVTKINVGHLRDEDRWQFGASTRGIFEDLSPSLEVEDNVFLPFFVAAADVNDNDGASRGSKNGCDIFLRGDKWDGATRGSKNGCNIFLRGDE